MRIAIAAFVGFFAAGGVAAPGFAQGIPGTGGRDIPMPTVPGGDVPGGGAPGEQIPEEIRPPDEYGDTMPGAPTVPGRDKLGAPSSIPGQETPADKQVPSTTGRDLPHSPGPPPGRDKLPSVPGR